jgi:hypothetical protein
MVFEHGDWQDFKWTFSDIKDKRIKEFLTKAKEKIN